MLVAMTEYTQTFERPYITAGKFYRVVSTSGSLYNIIDDTGQEIIIPKGRPAAHLEDKGSFKFFDLIELP